jgi:hypothetical protein
MISTEFYETISIGISPSVQRQSVYALTHSVQSFWSVTYNQLHHNLFLHQHYLNILFCNTFCFALFFVLHYFLFCTIFCSVLFSVLHYFLFCNTFCSALFSVLKYFLFCNIVCFAIFSVLQYFLFCNIF